MSDVAVVFLSGLGGGVQIEMGQGSRIGVFFAEYDGKTIPNHKRAVAQSRITTATVFISSTQNIDTIGDPIDAIIRRNGVTHYGFKPSILELTNKISTSYYTTVLSDFIEHLLG